jgi:hypothetical protein
VRKRAKRDLITLLGVVVVIAGIVAINTYLRLGDLKAQYERMRMHVEAKYRSEGVELIDWQLLKSTKGTLYSGATFMDNLKEKDGRLVNLVGFMAPIDQFNKVDEFMLLPVPINCYFCSAPPPRHIVHVKLLEKADMINEPVLIGGRLKLNATKGATFFQTIYNAKFNEAVKDEPATAKVMEEQHMLDHIQGFDRLEDGTVVLKEQETEELFPGMEPPSTLTPSHPGQIPEVDMGELLPGREAPSAGTVPPPAPEPAAPPAEFGPPVPAQ